MPNTTSAPACAVLSWPVRVLSVCVVVTRARCHPVDRAASSNRDEAVWPNSVHHHRIAANASQRSRVVIVGAGFGGLFAATRDVLSRHRNVSVLMAEVTGFDLEAREVRCQRPDGRPLTLPFDSLIVAAGAGQSYFGHDEFAEWAPGMKTLADAVAHRTRIARGSSPSSSSEVARPGSRSRARSPSSAAARSRTRSADSTPATYA